MCEPHALVDCSPLLRASGFKELVFFEVWVNAATPVALVAFFALVARNAHALVILSALGGELGGACNDLVPGARAS